MFGHTSKPFPLPFFPPEVYLPCGNLAIDDFEYHIVNFRLVAKNKNNIQGIILYQYHLLGLPGDVNRRYNAKMTRRYSDTMFATSVASNGIVNL